MQATHPPAFSVDKDKLAPNYRGTLVGYGLYVPTPLYMLFSVTY